MPTTHELVMEALARYDALGPTAHQSLGPLEKVFAIAAYDSGELETMHQANRIAVAIAATLGAIGMGAEDGGRWRATGR